MIYEIISSFKIIVLLISSVFLFKKFLTNYSSGIINYLILLTIATLAGYSSPILFPTSFFLLVIFIEIIIKKEKINYMYLLIFIIIIISTYLNGGQFFGYDQNIALGILMLSVPVSNWLYFQTTFKLIISLLSYIISYCLFIYFKIGAALFDFKYILDDGSRLLTIQSYLSNQTDDLKIDPNFLSIHAGFGLILILILNKFYFESLLNYFKTFKIRFVNNKFKLQILLLVTIIFLSLIFLRGFSRGAVLALLFSLITLYDFKFLSKSFLITILIGLYFLTNLGFIDIFITRFSGDENLGGRTLIWKFIYNWITESHLFIFGTGLNYPWWNDWQLDNGNFIGLHNAWLTIILRLGIIGSFFFFGNILKNNLLKMFSRNPIHNIKRGIFVYIFIAAMTIDLMNGIFWWIAFAFSISKSSDLKLK